ncbi:interferon alpha/beta receptor 2-like [Toxotes jaculatrix]|uniref:interferon alpha/beta receptor 2-like n=1 Tax=Toxotes jaculatrix TaxID=941984 RepID=UPI001B3AD401|nr:interferon alpha/beta receptor 2-like [Toxotes jaculatrix]XP_040913715.1 interferon alpha/beta receptor 2-like [Toxotes jaculatrix]
MTALIWILTWLPQVLSAMSELPHPVNITLNSDHFIHILKWQPGPGTPTGVYYQVAVNTDKGSSWMPAAGCERVQHPLVCNLTDAFSDPRKVYFIQLTARLEAQVSQEVIYKEFNPITHTKLDLPLLTVTPCGRNICVHLQPPMEHLRTIYDSFQYTLKIESSSTDKIQFRDTKSLTKYILEDLAPGREYCVSVCISDSLESKKSNYSQPVCTFTLGIFSADPWISVVLCLLVIFSLVVLALLFFTGFICLKGRPLPEVLTSTHQIEGAPVIIPCHTPLSSIFNVKPTLPSSGEKRSSQSDDSEGDIGTDSTAGSIGGYKLRVGTNLLSSSSSSSSSLLAPFSPKPEPQPSFSSNQTSDLYSPQPEVTLSTETQSSAGQSHTLSTHIDTDSLTEGIIRTDEEKEEVGEKDSQDVNLLTLTFGRREEEEEEEEEPCLGTAEVEPESHSAPEEDSITPIQPLQTWDTREAAIEPISCSTDEDELSGYMGRPCTDVLQRLL